MARTRTKGRARAALLTTVLALCALTTPVTAQDADLAFHAERVHDPDFFMVTQRSLALDNTDNPHVAYGHDRLYYARHTGTAWVFETPNATLGIGNHASLALDGSNRAHISCYDIINGRVLYVTNASGGWVTSEIAAGVSTRGFFSRDTDQAQFTAIGLDDAGAAHVAYYDEDARTLRYATNGTGNWTTQVIDTDVGPHCSLVVDNAGATHVSYTSGGVLINTGPAEARYATNASGAWVTEVIDDNTATFRGGGVGYLSSLTLDAAGHAHVAYYDDNALGLRPPRFLIDDGLSRLKYATNASGSWKHEVVRVDAGLTSSIALRPDGTPVIAHVNILMEERVDSLLFQGDIELSIKSGNSWVHSVVEQAGPGVSIAIDGTGRHHLAYMWKERLRYADGLPGSFAKETLHTMRNSGEGTDLALDSAGNAHVLHRGALDLLYSTNEPGAWTTEVVDTDIVQANSIVTFNGGAIAADGSRRAHAVYMKRTFEVFRVFYATNATGAWVSEELTDDGGFESHSIATGPANAVHIVYQERGRGVVHRTNESGSWVESVVDALGLVGNRGLAVDATGKAHTAYQSGKEIRYATNASGGWSVQLIAVGNSVPFRRPVLAVESDGTAHIAADVDRVLHYGSNDSGTWQLTSLPAHLLFAGDIAVDATGSVHIVHGFLPFRYLTNRSGRWISCSVDGGGFGPRELLETALQVEEAQGVAVFDILPEGPPNTNGDAAIAVDAAGVAHFSYGDLTLGDLKYAMVVDGPKAPVITVDFATVPGTALQPDDYGGRAGQVAWDDKDTSSRCIVAPLEDDGLAESQEQFTFELTNPTGITELGDGQPATVTIQSPSAILPKKVKLKLNQKKPEKSRLTAAGIFDTGPLAVDLSGAATLTVGDLTVAIPGLDEQKDGSLIYNADGIQFRIRPARSLSSRGKFNLKVQRNLIGLVDADAPLTITFKGGSVFGSGRVTLNRGQFKLGRARGTLLTPRLFLSKANVVLKGAGKDAVQLSFGLVTEGAIPGALPAVTVSFGDAFTETIPGTAFSKKGDRFSYKGANGAITSMTLDFKKESVTVVAKGLTLGNVPHGPQTVTVTLDVEVEQGVGVRMVRNGKKFRY